MGRPPVISGSRSCVARAAAWVRYRTERAAACAHDCAVIRQAEEVTVDVLSPDVQGLAGPGRVLRIPGWPGHWPDCNAPEEPLPAPSSFVAEWILAGRTRVDAAAKVPHSWRLRRTGHRAT